MYIFQGRVLPERAQLTLRINELRLETFCGPAKLSVHIELNQICVFIQCDTTDMFTLRNFVYDFLYSQLAVLGFTHGHAYDLEITRVVTADGSVDIVFGIDIPCIAQQQAHRDQRLSPEALGRLAIDDNGQYLRRFLTDFTFAMKHALDTAFYCYRGLEALRQHCAVSNGMEPTKENKTAQWNLFRELSQTTREQIGIIEVAAQAVRHGGMEDVSDEQRQQLFTTTWSIAERYLRNAVRAK